MIAPDDDLDISRLESDMEKLGSVYYLGYEDMKDKLPALKDYLNS